jgi:hypothetical protein
MIEIKNYYNRIKRTTVIKEKEELTQKIYNILINDIRTQLNDIKAKNIDSINILIEKTFKKNFLLINNNENAGNIVKKMVGNIPLDIDNIYNIINVIDTYNATSDIGTLEFLDNISKYYTTETICVVDDKFVNNNYDMYTPTE